MPKLLTVPRWIAPVLCVVACGLARLWYLAGSKAQFNADEATTGIMVRQILHGHNYVFYAGQAYGGTLEEYLQAGMYLILRLPQDAFTLRFVQVALSMATCAFVYLVGARVLPSAGHAVVAAAVYAVAPWFNVIGGATSLGFYVAGQFTALAALYCAIRLASTTGEAAARRSGVTWAFAVGLLSGLGLWTTVATLYLLVPVAIWLIPVLWRNARWSIAVVVGVVIGAAPLIGALVSDPRLPVPTRPIEDSTPASRLGNLFDPVLREFIGVTYAHGDGGLPLAIQITALVALLAGYAFALSHRRRGLLDLIRLQTANRTPVDLLLVVPVVVVIAYTASDTTWYIGTPRYLFVAYPLFAVALAALVPRMNAVKVAAGGAVIAVVLGLLTVGFFRGLVVAPSVAEQDRVFRQVAAHLNAERQRLVYADYWTAMPLQYVAGDTLSVAVCRGSKRFHATQVAVAAAPVSVSVYLSSPLDGASDPIGTALRSHHVHFRATTIGFVTIYDEIPGKVRPADLGL